MNTSLLNIEQALSFVELVLAASKKDTDVILKSLAEERKKIDSASVKVSEDTKALKELSTQLVSQKQELEEGYLVLEKEKAAVQVLKDRTDKLLKDAETDKIEQAQKVRVLFDQEKHLESIRVDLNTELRSATSKKELLEKGLRDVSSLKAEYEDKLTKLRNVIS
jgi:chromosome segregation ATPase